jgi:hypothetical protein
MQGVTGCAKLMSRTGSVREMRMSQSPCLQHPGKKHTLQENTQLRFFSRSNVGVQCE